MRVQRTRRRVGITKQEVGVIAVGLVCFLGLAGVSEAGETRLRVFFPNLTLDRANGERIRSLTIKMSCGRFRGVLVIPNDWSLNVVGPSSEETRLEAESGHGSTALWSLEEWDGSVVVSGKDEPCFDISATVISSKREYRFKRSELVLKP